MKPQTRIAVRRLRTRARHAIGEQRRRLAGSPVGPRTTLLVLGCQRSGTTLVTDLFAADPAVKVYPEHSELSARDAHGLRLDLRRDVWKLLAGAAGGDLELPSVLNQREVVIVDGDREVALGSLAERRPGDEKRNEDKAAHERPSPAGRV